jgi:hypothetical protein
MTEPEPWPARENLPPPPPPESEQERRRFAHGTGIAGFVCTVVAIVVFFVPFLDLLFALGGIAFSSRSLFLARNQSERLPAGVPLALAGLILGVLALVPGILISYDAAYRH